MSELLLPITAFEGPYDPPARILIGPPGWDGLKEGESVPEALPPFGELDEVGAQLGAPAVSPLGSNTDPRVEEEWRDPRLS